MLVQVVEGVLALIGAALVLDVGFKVAIDRRAAAKKLKAWAAAGGLHRKRAANDRHPT